MHAGGTWTKELVQDPLHGTRSICMPGAQDAVNLVTDQTRWGEHDAGVPLVLCTCLYCLHDAINDGCHLFVHPVAKLDVFVDVSLGGVEEMLGV